MMIFLGVRRRKTSVDKSQDEEEDGGNKRRARDSSASSATITPVPEANPVEKSSVVLRKPIAFSQNGSTILTGDEPGEKKKRGRKPKSEAQIETNKSIVRFCFFSRYYQTENL